MHQLALARPCTGSVLCSHHSDHRRGFTLVELLVVIGIISILIGILLPTLASARRAGNSVKCLASMKEIGNAFSMYAMENKGYFPPTRDTVTKTPTGGAFDRRWTDYLAKYVNKKGADFTIVSDLMKIRQNSVIWGCPEWAKSFEFDPNKTYDVYTGYGMNYAPGYPEKHVAATNAHRIPATPERAGYIKQSIWGRRASERLLIADSTYDYIQIPPNGYTVNTKFAPYDVLNPAAPADDFYVDARHIKPGTRKEAARGMTPVNALFVDGHAGAVSPKQAYNAIRSPGAGSIVKPDVK